MGLFNREVKGATSLSSNLPASFVISSFVALEFDYPNASLEAEIIIKETGIDAATANLLVKFAHMTRNLKGQGLDEGASTRLLVHAAKLIHSGVDPVVACRASVAQALTDDRDMLIAYQNLSQWMPEPPPPPPADEEAEADTP